MKIERKKLEKRYDMKSASVEDVSLKEHYDIRVIDQEGERCIEVKGYGPLWLTAGVTPSEYTFAMENKDRYWLYIVANLKKKKHVILKIFKLFCEGESKIYAVIGETEEDITNDIRIHIVSKERRFLSVVG